MATNLIGQTTDSGVAGLRGESTNNTNAAGPGVRGVSKTAGVVGESQQASHGVVGLQKQGVRPLFSSRSALTFSHDTPSPT